MSIALVIVAITAGVSAVIVQAQKRQDGKKRFLKFKTGFRYYVIEFLVGVLAGVLMYCLAVPQDETRMILLGILAGVNGRLILQNSKNLLDMKRTNAIRDIDSEQMDIIGEDDIREEESPRDRRNDQR